MVSEIDASVVRAAHERTTRVMRVLLRIFLGATAVVVVGSFFDSANDWRITFALHGTNLAMILAAWKLVESGRPRAAAWMVSFAFWAMVAVSAWLFGGLRYELGSAYIVCVMVAGTTLGGRTGMFFAGLSIVMSTIILVAHLGDWLPPPLTPMSVINAYISLTVSMLLGGYIFHVAQSSLEAAVRNVVEVARARDVAQRRFVQAQKMEPVGRLAAGVAHDFNNLLAAITTISGVLRKRVGDQPRVAPLLDDLETATDRAAMMTRQLLAFSRAREPSFDVFELDSTIRRSASLLSRLLGDEVEIQLDLRSRGARVRADRGQIEQVLLNLAVNARDAMPNGGTLRIATSVRAEPRLVRLEVTDTGTGIDAETRGRLFEPFFTTKSSGTGLGLSTVRDIVDSSGASIEVDSELGFGTTFILEFPERDAVSSDDLGLIDDSEGGALPVGLRVLLVEDHELVRRSTRQVLEDAGFDVTAVNDGSEALVLLEGGSEFDAVVSDLRMPRLSGESLAAALVLRGIDVPMVFMSGHEDRMPEALENLPFPKRFFRKPLATGELVAGVRDVIAEDLALRSMRGSHSA